MEYRKLKTILIVIILSTACNWFNPRNAENPREEESEWQEPVSPSIVISNLERAFEDRNIVNYSSSLSFDFMFYGDQADSTDVPPGIFNDWDFDVEIEVATKIFNIFSKINIYFEDSLKDSTGTEANFYEVYSMNLESLDSTVIVKGLAHFQLLLDSTNLWSIVNWMDFNTDSLYIDWGILKANTR